MHKISSGYSNKLSSGDPGATKPLDPDSMGLVLPVAAMALASYAGYGLANKKSDEEAAKERKARIRKNMNKLSKANLEILRAVRKEAMDNVLGTFINPFQGQVGMGTRYVPPWFRPSGASETTKADSMIFHALALAATYGLGTAGLKYILNKVEREKERQEGNTEIEEAVKASMPIISPDPSLGDLSKEVKESRSGLDKNVLLKESAKQPYKSVVPDFLQNLISGRNDPHKQSLSDSVMAAIMLAATGAFAAGAVLTKDWADDRDPNRQRLKAAEQAAKRRALQERPPAIIGAIDPKIKQQLDRHITEGRLRIRPQLTEGSVADQEVDPTDTLTRNISAV